MILHHAYKYIYLLFTNDNAWVYIEHILPWLIIRSTRMSYSIYKKSRYFAIINFNLPCMFPGTAFLLSLHLRIVWKRQELQFNTN